MNRAIKAVTLFSFLLIMLLIGNLTYIQAFQTDSLAKNPKNARQYYEVQSRQRGQISAGGQILAKSVRNDSSGNTSGDSEDDKNRKSPGGGKNTDVFYTRHYIHNPAAFGSVVGYLSNRYGASGIEASQNSILSGEDDSLFTRRLWDELTGKEPRGANIELTLQPNVQRVAYDQLASNGYSGSVVALKPSTGEVLAMASTPSFNPSSIVEVDGETAQENFAALNNNPNAPLLNRATQQTQPPGSTFKLITTAAALENGDNADTPVTAASNITLPGTNTTLENYGGQRCGPGDSTTLREAFRQSCNAPFVQLAIKHGKKAFTEVAEGFGIGTSATELGLPNQKSTIGDIPDDAALGQSAIGQRDVALTPLQNAIIAATIANGGIRMQPHLISKITGPDLKPLRVIKPKRAGVAIPKKVAEQMRELMLASEQHGSGQANIASKTGTAEHGEDSRGSKPHAWYVAFSTEADVAVAVLVENGGNQGQAATGNSVAGPIGRAVINAAQQEQR